LGMWERVFNYAKAKGMRTGDNPCAWRGCFEYRFARRRAQDRGHFAAMDYQHIPAFMKELLQRQVRGVSALCLEFVILTSSRTGEALGMTWSEIDFDKRLWTIPPDRMKAGKKHEVPLSNRAIEILKLQRQYTSGSGYVFEGYNRTRLADRSLRSVLHYMKVNC